MGRFCRRWSAMLLVVALILGCFPGVAHAAVGDIISDPEGTGVVGELDTQDTIRWPITVYDYLNDGMLFEPAMSIIYDGNYRIGVSYGGGAPMPMTEGIVGVDYTSEGGYYQLSGSQYNGYTIGQERYAFLNWGETNASVLYRGIEQPQEDADPMYLHLKNVGTGRTGCFGWVSNFARDDQQYYDKEDIRYMVLVYRTNVAYGALRDANGDGDYLDELDRDGTGHALIPAWAVSDLDYAADLEHHTAMGLGGIDISDVGVESAGSGRLYAQETVVPPSADWTYLVVDMKTDPDAGDGIASWWDQIGAGQIAGVGLRMPLLLENEAMDISHIAYFGSAEEAENFGENCVAFDNDPGEYLGYTVEMVHTVTGETVQTQLTRADEPVYPGLWNTGNNMAYTMLYSSNGGGWMADDLCPGGWNDWANGYYSYPVGNSYIAPESSRGQNWMEARDLGYPVSDSVYLLMSYANYANALQGVTYETDSSGSVISETKRFDMSQLDLGYTLYSIMKGNGAMTAGLLEPSLVTHKGIDGTDHRIFQYKEAVVDYIAMLLSQTLVIPEKDAYGYNYNFVKGTESPLFYEDLDGDGYLDENEDLNANGKLDGCDLATALRARLGIVFTEENLSGTTAAQAQAVPGAELGSYQETAQKFTAGTGGENLLIGPFLQCAEHIETFYDAAYYLLHNLFVPGSYNQAQDSFEYLQLGKAVLEEDDCEAYVFDAGFSTADGQCATVYDTAEKVIYQTAAESKHQIYYSAGYTTALWTFQPIDDSGDQADDPFGPNGTPYFLDDGAMCVQTQGVTYEDRNCNYVVTSNGEFQYRYDEDLFLQFRGEDDTYLFVNGELVLDVGGSHSDTTVTVRLNDYVDAARAQLNALEGYTSGMTEDAFYQLLADAGITDQEVEALLRAYALDLVDGETYPIDFYYMQRTGCTGGFRMETNIAMVEPETITLYCDAPESWTTCYAYWWNSDEGSDLLWPGVEMELVEGTRYRVEVPAGMDRVIFNDWDTQEQTPDLVVPTDEYVVYDYDRGVWTDLEGNAPGDDVMVRVYCKAPESWTAPYAFYWDSGSTELAWPGEPMTLTEDGLYVLDVSQRYCNIIFSDAGSDQTADLTIPVGNEVLYDVESGQWTVLQVDTVTVYFKPSTLSGTPYAHWWNASDTLSLWPGTQMTAVEGTGMFSVEVPTAATNILFHDNAGTMTTDLTIPEGDYVLYDETNATWTVLGGPLEQSIVYCQVPDTWTDPYAYYWNSEDTTLAWPGVAMTLVEDRVYAVAVPEGYPNIIFSDGGQVVTPDLTIPEGVDPVYDVEQEAWTVLEGPVEIWCSAPWIWSEVYIDYWTDAEMTEESYHVEKMERVAPGQYRITVPHSCVMVSFWDQRSQYTSIIERPEGDVLYFDLSTEAWVDEMPESDNISVYLLSKSWASPYACCYDDAGALAEMPGVGMAIVDECVLYRVDVPRAYTQIVFSDYGDEATDVLQIPEGDYVLYDLATGSWTVFDQPLEKQVIYLQKPQQWDGCRVSFTDPLGAYEFGGTVNMMPYGDLNYMITVSPLVGTLYFSDRSGESTELVSIPADGSNWYEPTTGIWSVLTEADIVQCGYWGEGLSWELDEDGVMTIAPFDWEGVCWNTVHHTLHGLVETLIYEEGVTQIGTELSYAERLRNVYLPKTVVSIDTYAFHDLPKLEGIWVDADDLYYCNDAYGVLYDKGMTTLLKAPTMMGGSYTVPEGVTTIGTYAFAANDQVEHISIPDTVTEIGASAFRGCSALQQVQLSSQLTQIANNAFTSCDGLTEVVIPDGVTSIGESAFNGCGDLASVTLPDSLVTIGDYAFCGCSSLTEMTIPEGVTDIGKYAFSYCTKLQTLTLPETLDTIGQNAFKSCNSLTDVYYGGSDVQWAAVSIGENNAPLDSATIHYGKVHTHSYEAVVTEPSCTKDGYTTYTCAVCGDSYTDDVVAAAGHSYESVTTEATCTEDGSIVYTCACGDTYTETLAALGHSYADGVCTVCGMAEPVTIPTLTLKYPSLSFESEIMYNVYFTAENLEDVVEMGLITFHTNMEDGTIEDADDVIPGFETDGTLWKVNSHGIPGKMLADTLYFKVYAKLSDGSYHYTGIKSYSALDYANTILSRESSSQAMKALVVAMLDYGAEAQLFFGYNTDSLANATLTVEQQALVEGYDETMVDDVVDADIDKVGSFIYDGSSFTKRAPSVSFDGAFCLNFYFTAANSPDDGMMFYYWDMETYESVDQLTIENATGAMEMATTDVAGQYHGQVAGIAAKQIDETVFVAGVYTCDGVAYDTGILSYSLGRYCETIAARETSDQKAFAEATAVYGYYAKSYFNGL